MSKVYVISETSRHEASLWMWPSSSYVASVISGHALRLRRKEKDAILKTVVHGQDDKTGVKWCFDFEPPVSIHKVKKRSQNHNFNKYKARIYEYEIPMVFLLRGTVWFPDLECARTRRHDGRDETVWHGKSITPGHQNHPRPSQPRRPPRNPGPPLLAAAETGMATAFSSPSLASGCVAALQHCRALQLEHRVCDGAKVLFVWIQRVSTDLVIQRYSNIKKTS